MYICISYYYVSVPVSCKCILPIRFSDPSSRETTGMCSCIYFSDNREFEMSYFCIFNKLAATFNNDIFMNNDCCP